MMWLIGVDVHSKWPTEIPMRSTTANATNMMLRYLFALHGLPEQLETDNGSQFTAMKFKELAK